MQNILQCATDGAATALMKKKIPGSIATHCIIHWQHLVAHNLSTKLYNSLHIVIKCTNKIKAHYDRFFHTHCHNNKDFERLLLHTAV